MTTDTIKIPDCKKYSSENVFFNIPFNKKIKVSNIKIQSTYLDSFNYTMYKWSSDKAYERDSKTGLLVSVRLHENDVYLVKLKDNDIISDYFILEYRILNNNIKLLDITYEAPVYCVQ